mgnify:CR=1 FL=1
MVILVIFLGLLSNIVGDAGYIILLPIAATLFHSVGLHPVAGIITAYVSVSCGYSANLMLSTLDPMLAATTQEAADMANVSPGNTGPLCNYYFLFASTFLLAFIIYQVTRRNLLPALGEYAGHIRFNGYKQLSRKERRAMIGAVSIGVIYTTVILWATFSSWGILRSVNGGLIRSPFIEGILFLLSFGIGLMGMVYGFASGRYRTDGDVIEGLTQPMKLLGVYFVIAFFAAQMFACFEYSHLDKCIAIMGADMLSSIHLGSLWILILFILFIYIPGMADMGGWFELLFVNVFGLSFHTGLISFLALTFFVLVGAIYRFRKRILHTSLWCLLMLTVGYTTYAVILIRANANTPLNENAPDNIFTLKSYLNREQYESAPLLYGKTYASEPEYVPEGDYYRVKTTKGSAVYLSLIHISEPTRP